MLANGSMSSSQNSTYHRADQQIVHPLPPVGAKHGRESNQQGEFQEVPDERPPEADPLAKRPIEVDAEGELAQGRLIAGAFHDWEVEETKPQEGGNERAIRRELERTAGENGRLGDQQQKRRIQQEGGDPSPEPGIDDLGTPTAFPLLRLPATPAP